MKKLSSSQSNKLKNSICKIKNLETLKRTDMNLNFFLDFQLCKMKETKKVKACGHLSDFQNKQKIHKEKKSFRKVYKSFALPVCTFRKLIRWV